MSSKYHVKKLEKKNDHLSILWKDNFESKFHFMWLRDNCPTAIHPTANMRVFNILTVSKNIFPKKYKIEKNKLNIDWSEGDHSSKFNLKWLRDHCYTEINNRKYKSPYVFWDGKLKKNLKKIIVDHNSVIKNDKHLSKWLNLLHTYGFALIKNAPTSKKSAFKILNRISHHRETFFGTPFEVINIPKPNNTAYTADALRNHIKFKDTDYTQKAVRILHSPIITLTKDNDFNDIRFSMAAMGAVDVDPKKMKKFYDAYQYFASLLQNKKFKIDFRLEAGDIFCFNNRRVLHGRTEFDPNSGNRHLQGYYIERDEIIGRLNYFNNIKV